MSYLFNGANLFHIEFTILSFRKYIDLVEDKFSSEAANTQERFRAIQSDIEENKSQYPPEYLQHLLDNAIEEMIEIDVEFIHRFRSSIIIQIFSFLEVELKKFCENHSIQFSKEYSIDDLKGKNDIDKAKKYLKRSANIDITSNQKQWRFLTNLRKLRNKIVHHKSILLEKDNDINALKELSVGNFELKSIENYGYEILLNDKKFILKCLEQIEKFLKALEF